MMAHPTSCRPATHRSGVGGAWLQAGDGAVGGVGAGSSDARTDAVGRAQRDVVGGVGASRRGRGDGGGHSGGAGGRLAGQGGLGSGWRGDGNCRRGGAGVATGVNGHNLSNGWVDTSMQVRAEVRVCGYAAFHAICKQSCFN